MFTQHYMSFVTFQVSGIRCQVSCVGVRCQVSGVRCQLSHIVFFYLIKMKIIKSKLNILRKMDKVVQRVSGGSVISGAYPVQFFTEIILKLEKVSMFIENSPPANCTTFHIHTSQVMVTIWSNSFLVVCTTLGASQRDKIKL